MMVKSQIFMLLCFFGLLLGITHGTYQEMTHVMDMETMVLHPAYADEKYHFVYRIDHAGPDGDTPFLAFNSLSTVEHMGTHYDAPYHFSEDGRQTQDIPLEDFHGPLVRIDITEKVAADNMSTVDVSDILAWEEENGPIPERAYILMYSGWSQYWGDQLSYVGTGISDSDWTKMAWPSFTLETVAWLLENRPDFLGIGGDVMACDVPNTNAVHMVLLPADKMCLENLNNLDKVPASGAEFYFLPLLVQGGTGGQIRAYALWDTEVYTGTATLFHVNMAAFLAILLTFILKGS